MTTERVMIEKLKESGENFTGWKILISSYLRSRESIQHLEAPPEDATQRETFLKNDAKLQFAVINSLSEPLLADAQSLTTVKEIVDYFANLYDRKSPIQVAFTLRDMFRYKFKPEESITGFSRMFKQYMFKLESMKWLSRANLNALLLMALVPDDYDDLLRALDGSTDTENITMDKLEEKLMNEEKRIKKKRETSTNADANAYRARENQPQVAQTSKKYKNKNKKKSENKFCDHCHKSNHWKSECFILKRMNQSAKAANDESETNDEVGFISVNENNSNKAWHIDSAASSHFTSDIDIFENFKAFKENGGYVRVANGEKEPIMGIGTITIKQKQEKLVLENAKYVPTFKCNLISVNKLIDNDKIAVNFSKKNGTKECKIVNSSTGKVIINSQYKEGSFEIKENALAVTEEKCIHQYHLIFAHRNLDDIKKMPNLKLKPCSCNDRCEDCIIGKMKKMPFPQKSLSTK